MSKPSDVLKRESGDYRLIKDVKNIIHKYHHNLLMKDVCDEIKNIAHSIRCDRTTVGRGPRRRVIKSYYSFNGYFSSHYYQVHHQTMHGRVLAGLLVTNGALLSQNLD